MKNKNKQETMTAGKEVTLGVTGEGNALHRKWLIAMVAILLPLLAGFAYLLLARETALRDQQIVRTASSFAVQQAASVEQYLLEYRERLRAAANSPLSLSAIASGRAEDLALVEKAMLDYFPGAASIRVIALGELGTATLESANVGLRNHIELDLVRRTSEGEVIRPESYRFDGRWLTSLAEAIKHPGETSRSAVILATIDNQAISAKLSGMGAELGRSSLVQVYRDGNFTREDEIAAAGSGGAEQYSADAALNGGAWRVMFTPSAQMLSLYRIDSMPLIIVLAILTLVVLAAMGWLLVSFQRALESEVGLALDGAERKAALKLNIPALVPIARLLRLKTQQATSTPAATRPSRPAPAREPDTGITVTESPAEEPPAPAPAKRPRAAIPEHVFRAYDIRGIVDTELTESFVNDLGRALGTLAGQRGEQALIVGCDGRTTSAAIKTALVKALAKTGRDVIDIGLVPTPVLYFATNTMSTQSGVMVTASHNPPEYNGFKITLAGKPLAGDDLLQLRELMKRGEFSKGAGKLAKKDMRAKYLDAVVSDVPISNPLHIVVDAGNGAAGDVGPAVLEGLGCEVTRLYCDIDGSFPNHHPDPGVDANLEDLQAKVVEVGADFGVAFDGDGDRLTVVTANGDIVRNDMLLMVFVDDIVVRNPGADVIFDVKCTRHLTQLVSKQGGRPILWKTGHAYMRQKVMETGALLGGEFSGHFYFGERWYGFDDAIYAAARLAEIISGTGVDLATILAEYPQTVNTPEIAIAVSDTDKFAVIQRLAESGDFSPGKVNKLDGVRVDYSDGWGLLRASNTTPALTARFEADSAEALERIQEQFRTQLKEAGPGVEPGF